MCKYQIFIIENNITFDTDLFILHDTGPAILSNIAMCQGKYYSRTVMWISTQLCEWQIDLMSLKNNVFVSLHISNMNNACRSATFAFAVTSKLSFIAFIYNTLEMCLNINCFLQWRCLYVKVHKIIFEKVFVNDNKNLPF